MQALDAAQAELPYKRHMGEITDLLGRSAAGDPAAMDAVFQQVYPELRRLARAQLRGAEHTLTPTALVHEAYLKLVGGAAISLECRRHFFACAARAMRNLRVDRLRSARADKRGSGIPALALDGLELHGLEPDAPGLSPQLLDLDAALDALDLVSQRQRQVVELHFFAGLTHAEIGELLGCTDRTVLRDWQRARAFLHARMGSRR